MLICMTRTGNIKMITNTTRMLIKTSSTTMMTANIMIRLQTWKRYTVMMGLSPMSLCRFQIWTNSKTRWNDWMWNRTMTCFYTAKFHPFTNQWPLKIVLDSTRTIWVYTELSSFWRNSGIKEIFTSCKTTTEMSGLKREERLKDSLKKRSPDTKNLTSRKNKSLSNWIWMRVNRMISTTRTKLK